MLPFGFLKHFCQDFIFFFEILMPQSCRTSFTAETGSNWKQKQLCKTWKISVKSCTIQQNFIWKNLPMKKIRNFHGKSVKESNQEKISWNQSPLFCRFMMKFQKLDQEFRQMMTWDISQSKYDLIWQKFEESLSKNSWKCSLETKTDVVMEVYSTICKTSIINSKTTDILVKIRLSKV